MRQADLRRRSLPKQGKQPGQSVSWSGNACQMRGVRFENPLESTFFMMQGINAISGANFVIPQEAVREIQWI
jgi:hypothetical protein